MFLDAEFAPHPRRMCCAVLCAVVGCLDLISSIVLVGVENVNSLLHHLKVREEDHVDDGRTEYRYSQSYLGAESV